MFSRPAMIIPSVQKVVDRQNTSCCCFSSSSRSGSTRIPPSVSAIGFIPIAFFESDDDTGGGRRAQIPINVSSARSAAWHAPAGYWSGWGGVFEYAWTREVHAISLTNPRECQLAGKERSAPPGTIFVILSTSRLNYPKLPSHLTRCISNGYDKSFALAAPVRASSTSLRISGASVTDCPLSSTL